MRTPPRKRPSTRGERGSVLAGVLAITAALMGAAALAAFSGYTNLLVTTNLRAGARAKASAEASINEAIHRLALPDTAPGAIVPALTDPDWNVGIHFTTGDTNPADHTLSTIQAAAHWPTGASPATPAVTMQFKRDEDGNVVYYNRLMPPANPPFLTVDLPSPIGPIVGSVYDVLCEMPSILGIQVGGLLGLCPVGLPAVGYPVIELRATGVDARGARL